MIQRRANSRRPALLGAALAATWSAGLACGGSVAEEVLVSAAASLADAFAEMETAFEQATPGVDVVLNLAASSALREQILAGGPADVFASADMPNMDRVVEDGRTAGPARIFATNHLEIGVPAGNPAGVTGLADFAREELWIGLGAKSVPCGALAWKALRSAGVEPSVDTVEPHVRALRTKIEAGELDAGILYATDVLSSRDLDGIEIPEQHDFVVPYPIAVLTAAPNPEAAASFVAFVLSAPGQAILARHGFASP